MAELSRWQWDDAGTWRDFAEQYQAQMEAAFQRRERSVELSIPPFGTFRMELQKMAQITVRGRNPGYEREIRRQVRKIELGYFLLGYEGEICSSDSLVDRMEDVDVVDNLAKVLRRICDEPEEFSFRSLNLVDDEFRDNLGANEEAQQFLEELGFELIEEGPQSFMVFMQEQVEGLRGALKDVEARLKKLGVNPAVESNACVAADSNLVESNDVVECNNVESNDVSSKAELGSGNVPKDSERSQLQEASPAAHPESQGESPASCEVTAILPSGDRHCLKLPGNATLEDLLRELKVALPSMRLPCLKRQAQQEQWPRLEASLSGTKAKKRKGSAKGKGKSKTGRGKPSNEPGSVEAAEASSTPESADPVMHQVPILEMSLASEPGVALWRACPRFVTARDAAGKQLVVADPEPTDATPATPSEVKAFPPDSSAKPAAAEPVVVEDFEEAFTKRLQTGLLRLRDLASVAPLLDWEKPELPKMLTGRVKSLLEGSCEAWCKAAGSICSEELQCARALLRRVYGSLPMDERLRICRELLPPEKRDRKAHLQVDRGQDFLKNTFTGLMKLTVEELRNPLSIRFAGEVAEDYGGPRRDFFCMIGTRLCNDLKALWRRLPTGALAPVPDAVSEVSPKDHRAGLDEVEEAYRASGRAAGLAVKYGDVLAEEFAGFFVYQVARDDTVGLEELQRQIAESEGSDDIRASKKLLESHVSESGIKGMKLTRTITGTCTEVELVPGGHDVEVTEENKADWLRLHLHDKLYRSMQKAADSFRAGILDIWGGTRRTCPLLVLLTPAELVRIWAGSGVTDADVRRWKEVATVSDEVKTQAGWLWEILEEADEAYRSKVLKFTTGVHRIGYVGIQSFEVQPADGQDESLPRAMTCANMLQMPRYSSKDCLCKQLRKATELCDGFQIL